MMTPLVLRCILVAMILLAPGCVANRFDGATVSGVRVHEQRPDATPRAIDDPAALRELAAVLSRASLAKDSTPEVQEQLWAGWHLDVTGEKEVRGRWLYDPANGRVARMDIWSGRYVYTIQPRDRARFAALLH
jgi:hypothetical protein